MRIMSISDLHFEFHMDGGASFLRSLDPTGVDVLVVAGDLTTHRDLKYALQRLCDLFPHVVFVAGNHEFYDTSPAEITRIRTQLKIKNLHWLEQSTTTIDGVRFVGATLWFPPPSFPPLKASYNDFKWIRGYEPWVYEQNEATTTFLAKELGPKDVLVTHFLPMMECVTHEYQGHALNCFFVAGDRIGAIVKEKKPQLVLCGHTHSSTDFHLDGMHVFCNPFGYVGFDQNPQFSTRCVTVGE